MSKPQRKVPPPPIGRPRGPKMAKVIGRVLSYDAVRREILTLDCGHTITQALRPTVRRLVFCPTCADARPG